MGSEYALMKIISDYKKIIRRQLSHKDSRAHINTLGIKCKHLRSANHAEILEKVRTIQHNVQTMIQERESTPLNYSGLNQFLQHIDSLTKQHTLNDNEEVVNTIRLASKAVVETIQLVQSSEVEQVLPKIQDNIHTTLKYGSEKQKTLLVKALKKQADSDHTMLAPLVHCIESKTNGNCSVL